MRTKVPRRAMKPYQHNGHVQRVRGPLPHVPHEQALALASLAMLAVLLQQAAPALHVGARKRVVAQVIQGPWPCSPIGKCPSLLCDPGNRTVGVEASTWLTVWCVRASIAELLLEPGLNLLRRYRRPQGRVVRDRAFFVGHRKDVVAHCRSS